MIRRLVSLALVVLLAPGFIAAGSGCGVRKDVPRKPGTAEDSLADWRGRADSLDGSLGSLDPVRGQIDPGHRGPHATRPGSRATRCASCTRR